MILLLWLLVIAAAILLMYTWYHSTAPIGEAYKKTTDHGGHVKRLDNGDKTSA